MSDVSDLESRNGDFPFTVDKVRSLEELSNRGYRFHPDPKDSTWRSTLPPWLGNPETLRGPFVCFLPQSQKRMRQSLRKTFEGVTRVPHAYLYIKYYARLIKDSKYARHPGFVKDITVWPAKWDTNRISLLPETPHVGWSEALVELDFSHPVINSVELTVRGFEKSDCFIIQQFAVAFAGESLDIPTISQRMLIMEEADTVEGPEKNEYPKLEISTPREGGFTFRNCFQSVIDFLLWPVRFCCHCFFQSSRVADIN